MIRVNLLILLGVISVGLGGCGMIAQFGDDSASQVTEGDRLNIVVLHNGLMCGLDLTRPNALWIDNATQLTQRYAQMAAVAQPPMVDFEQYGVLLVTMGQQPTSGYRLNFLPDAHRVILGGQTLQINLAWEQPSADSIQAQVLTQPCLLLQVPRRSFTRVEILDQRGTVRLGRRIGRVTGS